jgi:molybdate transport system permease protein
MARASSPSTASAGRSRPRRAGSGRAPAALLVPAALGAALFVLPLVGLLLRAPWNETFSQLRTPAALDALRLSLLCTLTATAIAIVLGVPLAWVQARLAFPGQNLLRALTTLPMVLPPVVGGVALLLAFGRRGLIGGPLFDAFGIRLPFSTEGAILAETFVSMPFLVLTVEAGLRSMDHRLEDAARTLGARPWTVFRRVTLPLVAPSIFAGAVLCWSRALGEFGATITFAGNFPGQTQTLPLAVYLLLQTEPDAAIILSLVLVLISLAVLVSLRDRYLNLS